jgi:hypothetical protein
MSDATAAGAGSGGPEPAGGGTALRDRMADVIRQAAHWCGPDCLDEDDECDRDLASTLYAEIALNGEVVDVTGTPEALAVTVMPVVQAALAEQTQRAEQAEALAARYRMQIDDPDSLLHRLDEAEAAVQRVRAVHNGGSAENTVLCIACCNILPCPTLQALDRPERTQRDTAIRWQIGKGGLR